eukprot:scaffold48242_cov51-Phaeocystis_antarctica.AAC.2
MAPDGMAGSVPWLSAAAALPAAAFPSGERATHSAASSAMAKPAGLSEAHAEVARRALGHEQRQLLRLRLLPCLLARQRRRRYRPALRRHRLSLRRPCDAQRGLLGGGKGAQAHLLASTAPHLRLVGLGLAGLAEEVHAEVARLVLGHQQLQPLRLRLLPRLLARQRRRRCSPLRRYRPPLRRSRDAQRRLLSGGEAPQAHLLAAAPHPRLVGLGLAGPVEAHAEVACLVIGHKQRQPQLRFLQHLTHRLCLPQGEVTRKQ